MPIRFRWPFHWPRRKPAADRAPELSAQTDPSFELPLVASTTSPGSAPMHLSRAEPAASAGDLGAPDVDTPDLGLELLARLPALSTPPTLGRLGGLPSMAQALPAIDRFLAGLSAPPMQRVLPSYLSDIGGFAASLPALITAAGSEGKPAFPEQLQPPASSTDVLPPIGGLPGQLPGVSGAAPVLEPAHPTPTSSELVRVVVAPAVPEPGHPLGAKRAIVRPESFTTPPLLGSPIPTPGGLGLAAPLLPLAAPSVVVPGEPATPMTQVLPVQATLAGNVLPSSEFEPLQRQSTGLSTAWSGEAEFATPPLGGLSPAQAVPGERLTPEQRVNIENQRGQGRPLEPETRQQFEQAYGQSLADVRVHTDSTAHATASSLNAIAFASGRDLFFTQNTFAPDRPEGLSLLGHELAHVIQQQFGLPGDSDALRPATDSYEQQADQLASRALDTPVFSGPQPEQPAALQRVVLGEAQPTAEFAPGAAPPREPLRAIAQPGVQPARLSQDLPLTAPFERAEPVQRFGLSDLGSMARNMPKGMPGLPGGGSALDSIPDQVSGLTNELATPASLLSRAADLAPQVPGMPALGGLAGMSQNLPGLSALSQGTLPSLTRAAGGLGDLANQMPAFGGLAQGLPGLPGAGGLPSLGGLAHSPGGALPALPSLGGLTPPDMPLAEAAGGLQQAASGAASAGQEALGTITSMGPAALEPPAAPPLPSLEKLTEHVWKQVQHKLKVERERSRGLA